MKQRTRLICDFTAWGLVLLSVIGLGLCCIGLDQYSEDRDNHRQSQHKEG